MRCLNFMTCKAHEVFVGIHVDLVGVFDGATNQPPRAADTYYHTWRGKRKRCRGGILQMEVLTLERYLFTTPDTAKDGDCLLKPSNARRGIRDLYSPCTRFLEVVACTDAQFEAACTVDGYRSRATGVL